MKPVDRLLLGYLAFVSVVAGWRLITGAAGFDMWVLLGMHALLALLIALMAQHGSESGIGGWLHDFYPLILLTALYAALGVLNQGVGRASILTHDAVVQRWEAAVFGSQPSRDWVRAAPSVFWSGLLHLAYFAYYPIILLAPLALALRRQRHEARQVILMTMTAFVICYVAFILWPVAGPNYAFPRPAGPVREVWSARLVYLVLDRGSSIGTAFPSSHVAATVAATLGILQHWRRLGWMFVPAAILLTVGTVYCQMHYVSDATAGLAVGVAAWAIARRLGPRANSQRPISAATSS